MIVGVRWRETPTSASRTTAPGQAALLDTWGTQAQCDAHAAGITGDLRRIPHVLSEQWLQQGFLYCWIIWLGQGQSDTGTWTRAHLQCREDSLRAYDSVFHLSGDRLRIRWSDDFTTPALMRCR